MTVSIAKDSSPDSSSGGSPPLEGYLYQLQVSVWTALDLLLARKLAREVVLEPATKEDLEADIVDAPGALEEHAVLEGYRLVVQCKLCTTGSWKHGDITTLLSHGTRRKSAAELLKDTGIRYVLISNADVDGVARQLQVKTLGEWPAAGDMPSALAAHLEPTDGGGRIAILAPMDAEKIESRTVKLLTERFRVPLPKVSECQRALRDQALQCMRGIAGGIWKREQLEAIVHAHGGYAGDAASLEGFVPPINWPQIKAALAERHAVIIAGPSGTGKTQAARALQLHVRNELAGATVVHITGGPEKIHLYPSPVVFEIEDPWGRFRLEDSSIPWNERINEVLRLAGPDRKFIITSRSDVLRESAPKSLSRKWFVYLESEHYGPSQRYRLFENRRPGLPLALQRAAIRYQKEALERLTTPFEMQRYFDVLADGPQDEESDHAYIWRCLEEAQQGSLESSILNNLRKRDDWRWAAVVWGLLQAGGRLSFQTLPIVQAGLTRRDSEFEDGLEPYVNFLIAGRNLRQNGSVLGYHHPRVEAGLEQVLTEKPQLAARTLRHLIETLTTHDLDKNGDWGRECAARIVAAIRGRTKLDLNLAGETQAQLDAWFRDRLAAERPEFEDDLRLAAAAGSSACVPAELARWLTRSATSKGDFMLDMWSPEPADAQWYARIREDSISRTICEQYIRRVLPYRPRYFPDDFADHIAQVCPHLTMAFRDAALSIVQHGYNSGADVIAAGALKDLDAFGPVVEAAIAFEETLRQEASDGVWLALANGEYGEEAASHVSEQKGEEGWTADSLLKSYAAARRERGGWPALQAHPRVGGLVESWLWAAGNDGAASDEEWQAITQASFGGRFEARVWERLRTRWRIIVAHFLTRRLLEGSADSKSRIEAARLLAWRMGGEVRSLVETMLRNGDERRILELASDLSAASAESESREFIQATLADLTKALPSPLAEAVTAIYDGGSTPAANKESSVILERLDARADNRLKLAQARALRARHIDATRLLDELLAASGEDNDEEIEVMVGAVDFAVSIGHWMLVSEGLAHRFADVRERALTALATRAPGALPAELLALARDRGHRVRRTLAQLIRVRTDPQHMPALVQLAADTWSDQPQFYGDDERYPIARLAADILLKTVQIDDEYTQALVQVARETSDSQVARNLLAALVRGGSGASRQSVMYLALTTDDWPLPRLAAEALFLESMHVTAALAEQIADAQLLQRAASVAVNMTLLIGARAGAERVLSSARTLAADAARRALLIPLWLACQDTHPTLADGILEQLPPALATALRAAAKNGAKLPRTALEGLGDLRLTDQVISILVTVFEAKR